MPLGCGRSEGLRVWRMGNLQAGVARAELGTGQFPSPATRRQRLQDCARGPMPSDLSEPDHFVFPACERNRFDPNSPQKTWRTAWRSLIEETARRAGDSAAKKAAEIGGSVEEACKRATAAFINEKGQRLRFHDLRHQAITELGEKGTPEATVMALAGHLSR